MLFFNFEYSTDVSVTGAMAVNSANDPGGDFSLFLIIYEIILFAINYGRSGEAMPFQYSQVSCLWHRSPFSEGRFLLTPPTSYNRQLNQLIKFTHEGPIQTSYSPLPNPANLV